MKNWPGLHMIKAEEEEKKAAERLTSAYRAIFLNTDTGREVLDDILRECSFFSTLNPNDAGQVALHNLGKTILAKCGVLVEENTLAIIEAFTGIRATRDDR